MHKGLKKGCLPEGEKIHTHSSFDHLQSAIHGAPIRRCRVFGVSC